MPCSRQPTHVVPPGLPMEYYIYEKISDLSIASLTRTRRSSCCQLLPWLPLRRAVWHPPQALGWSVLLPLELCLWLVASHLQLFLSGSGILWEPFAEASWVTLLCVTGFCAMWALLSHATTRVPTQSDVDAGPGGSAQMSYLVLGTPVRDHAWWLLVRRWEKEEQAAAEEDVTKGTSGWTDCPSSWVDSYSTWRCKLVWRYASALSLFGHSRGWGHSVARNTCWVTPRNRL